MWIIVTIILVYIVALFAMAAEVVSERMSTYGNAKL